MSAAEWIKIVYCVNLFIVLPFMRRPRTTGVGWDGEGQPPPAPTRKTATAYVHYVGDS